MFRKKAYNTIWMLFAVLALCFIVSHPAQAADSVTDDITIDISYGYNNYQKNGRAMPVWIRVANKGSAFAGDLTLRIDNGTYSGMAFSKHISVLSKSQEEFVFYTPCLNSYTNITVTLTEDSTKESISLSEMTMNRLTDDLYLGILSNEPKTLETLTAQMAFSSPIDASYTPVRSVNLSDHELPENVEGYNGFDMIIASHFDASYMTEAQAGALRDWISGGGILLTGRVSDMTVFFEKLKITPLTSDTVQSVTTDFDADYETYVSTDTPLGWGQLDENPTAEAIEQAHLGYYDVNRPDISANTFSDVGAIVVDMDVISASVASSAVNYKLYQQLSLENGRILISKFDFSSEPFTGFEAATYVIQKIFCDNLTHADWTHFLNYSDDFRSSWSSQSVLLNTLYKETPDYSKYVIILFVYILIIGPLLYILLKKTDRRYLMWIAVPAVTVFFTCIVVAAGSSTRLTSPFINFASFINFDDGTAAEDTFYSVTMPEKEMYSQTIDAAYTVRPVNNNYLDYDSVWESLFINYLDSINSNDGITYSDVPEDGTDVSIDNKTLFSTRYFNIHRPETGIASLEENIVYKDGRYTGTIKNNTDYDIQNVCLIISGKIYGIGNVAPHDEISLDMIAMPENHEEENIEHEILNALNIPKDKRRDGEALVKVNMFFQFINDNYANSYPYILGYVPDYCPKAFENTEVPVTGLTLLSKKADIHYDHDGAFIVPDISQMMSVVSGEIYNLSMDMYSGEAEAAYNFDNRFILQKLEIIRGNEDIDIWAYNYKNGTYDPVFKNSTVFEAGIEDYFDENKILRLKFTQKLPNTSDNYMLPVISAAGKVK